MTGNYILTRLDGIEQELAELRRHVEADTRKFGKVQSLYGLVRDADFSEEEIQAISKSLNGYDYDE